MTLSLVAAAGSPLGLACTRALAARGDRLLAAVPNPNRVPALMDLAAEQPSLRVVRGDVETAEGRTAIAAAVGDEALGTVVLGGHDVLGPALADHERNRTLGELDGAALAAAMARAVVPMLDLAARLRPRLRGARILVLSDWTGSIADRRDGGDYARAAAYGALHGAARALAFELEHQAVVLAVGNPGNYKTALHAPAFQPDAADVAPGLLAALAALPEDETGVLIDRAGNRREW